MHNQYNSIFNTEKWNLNYINLSKKNANIRQKTKKVKLFKNLNNNKNSSKL